MYQRSHYTETRPDILHALMRAHPLAALVTTTADGPVADHVPMEFDPAAGPCGTLRGHVARANPIWQRHLADQSVLAIFQGPAAYVSPSFYPSKQTDPRVVPTWNYAVVHATGTIAFTHDPAWLRDLVGRLTEWQETARTEPWHVEDAPREYVARMLRAIVGFEILIERLDGKWKMSQNHPAANRAGVAAGLRASTIATAQSVAEIIERGLREGGPTP